MDKNDPPLLARQPILDSGLQVVGYELLCRPMPQDTLAWQNEHGDHATSEVLISAFNDIGIDLVTGGLPAFINFTSHWLHHPPIMPADSIVAELLEYIPPNDANLAALRRLKKLHYKIALDDYDGDERQAALFPLIDIVKVDIRRLPDLNSLPALIEKYRSFNLQWLAEKVETQEEYLRCRDAGCTLFQGYFFSHPANVYGKRLPDSQLAVLQLLQVLNDKDSRLEDVADILQTDPQLSYKLLQMVNSAAVGIARQITSVSRAIVIVGLDRLRAWSNLIALGRLQDKPAVLREQAVVRALMCKSLVFSWPDLDEETAFTLGLFSLLDAFLDQPLQDICERLRLPADLSAALTNHQGDYGFILATAVRMEKGQWHAIDWNVLQGMGVSPAQLEWHYLNALQTARGLLQSTD
ncbi:MAG: HDOD domain-containing protein [Saccharospirillaceae bacterium]|nr:HDOD domain-containing protein [Saccharospirillaceae bacterium]MCD8532796.1 HDOD domain-containing protein [Saccharospirillaceae bacterium]